MNCSAWWRIGLSFRPERAKRAYVSGPAPEKAPGVDGSADDHTYEHLSDEQLCEAVALRLGYSDDPRVHPRLDNRSGDEPKARRPSHRPTADQSISQVLLKVVDQKPVPLGCERITPRMRVRAFLMATDPS